MAKVSRNPTMNFLPFSLLPILVGLSLIFPAAANVIITEFLSANDTIAVPNAVAGTFDDWIELHNPTASPEDLSGWHLTDNPSDPDAWTFPIGTVVPGNGFLVVLASGDGIPDSNGNLRTNFRLASSGEYVALIRPELTVASEFGPSGSNYPSQSTDVSYGLHPDTGEAVFFATPTPGAANDPAGQGRVEGLAVSPRRGLYQTAQTVTLASSTAGATIYYTTDGTPPLNQNGTPTATATSYSGPIPVNRTTVVRASAAAPGLSPSPEETHTYLLFDIDNANPDGSDSAGLNLPFLQQSQPSGWGNLSSGDYNMDPDVTRSTQTSTGHGGLTVAQAMLEGMREVPTLSISMPPEDFVNIYANSTQRGIAWERACSAEFIPGLNDTRPDFQEHCGLRVQGGASRLPNRSPKHSLSFRFREEYGAGRLRQVLFPEVDVANFNTIALRAVYNNSWIHSNSGQRSRGSMIRDQWMRESLFEMGNEDAGAGFLAHVYVNGLYWGVHNICERQDNVHYANYNGGESDLIDARNGANFVNGNSTAWNAMQQVVSTRDWEDIQQVIDLDSYVDFQIIQRFGGNKDLKVDGNWRAAGGGPFDDPTEMRPWKLYSWDGERVLENVSDTAVPLDPMNVRGTLETMPEYRQRFADRAYQHLTGDGALTPDQCQARWEKHASAIDKAVIAESARWGDHRRSTPYTRNAEWLSEQNRLYNSYFNARTNNVINSLRSAGLFPALDPPAFTLNGEPSDGGFVGGGNTLNLSSDEGTVYYTTDGSDPRLPDGTINPNAISLTSGGVPEAVFPFESAGWRYLTNGVAQSDSDIVVGNPSYDATDWKHPNFNDGTWNAGQGLLAGPSAGAISGRTANTVFSLDSPSGRISTAYFRKEFEVTNASGVATLDLSIIRDDGVIVYLNGREIFRENMPGGTVAYADPAAGNADETLVLEHSYPLAPGELQEGTNVLAIEVHNVSPGNNDLGLDLAAGISRANLSLSESARLTARAREGSNWSAPVSGVFLVEEPANASNLIISEVNYHPREATITEIAEFTPLEIRDSEQFEFLEIRNVGSAPLNLFGISFTDGISFTSDLHALAPGEVALVVKNEEVFASRYGSDLSTQIIGTFTGSLANDGENLTLVDSTGSIISSFSYDDGGRWPSRPDGDGSSLERADFSGDPAQSANWAPSVLYDGSPGITGPLSDSRIVINEVSSNSTNDFIELHNTTASPIEIGGWLLTDKKRAYRSFTLPETTLAAFGYLTISDSEYDANLTTPINDFATLGGFATLVSSPAHGLTSGDFITISGYGGLAPYNGSFEVFIRNLDQFFILAAFVDNHPVKGVWERGRSFGLSAGNGDDLWLLEADENGKPLRFVDHVDFAAAAPETTLGRWPDGAGADTLVTMTANTASAPNSGPLLGPVYLTEVHYAPPGNESHEFAEVTNTGATSISLNQWRLRGGLDFNFTSENILAPGQSLVVVTFDPAIDTTLADNFRATFGISPSVLLVGPASDGPLSDEAGTVRLQMAGPAPDFDQITVDEVRYQSQAPWPIANSGNSLTRTASLAFGNFSASWTSATPTPGSFEAGESYAAWAAANGVGPENLDADGDTLVNFLEYALGTDPNQANALPPAVFDGDTGTISFPSHLTRTGFSLILETSPDLEEWTTRTTVVSGIEGAIQTNSYSYNRLANPTLFWRLTATSTGN